MQADLSAERKDKSNTDRGKSGMFISALCRIIGIFLILLVISFAAAIVIPAGLGYGTYNIGYTGTSREVPPGSIVYIKQAELQEISEGELIAFDRGSDEYDSEAGLAVGRVLGIDDEEGTILIESPEDADETETVSFSDVRGIAKYHLLFLGQFMDIYTTLPGKICMVGLALCGFLLNVLAGRIADRAREDKYE